MRSGVWVIVGALCAVENMAQADPYVVYVGNKHLTDFIIQKAAIGNDTTVETIAFGHWNYLPYFRMY